MQSKTAATPTASVELRTVPFDRPWEWLAAGWRDLQQRPSIGLAYGALVWLIGLGLTVGLRQIGHETMLPVLAGGFLLAGPILAAGLYDASRIMAVGGTPSISSSMRAGLQAAGRMALLIAFLFVVYLLWVRAAFLLFALFLGSMSLPPPSEFMRELLFTPHGLGLLCVGTAVGALLAAIVFATTAVAIPLLMDRKIDAITAMVTSVRAVIANPLPMGLWAALIAGFVLLGLITLGAGLVVAFPLLGHATWHAYRDLVA